MLHQLSFSRVEAAESQSFLCMRFFGCITALRRGGQHSARVRRGVGGGGRAHGGAQRQRCSLRECGPPNRPPRTQPPSSKQKMGINLCIPIQRFFSSQGPQVFEKNIFSIFDKYKISVCIRTLNCQKIFKIGSSELKRNFCTNGTNVQYVGNKKPHPLISSLIHSEN